VFSSFFIDKIQNVRRDLQTDQVYGIDQDADISSENTPLETEVMLFTSKHNAIHMENVTFVLVTLI